MAECAKRTRAWGPNTWWNYPEDWEALLHTHAARFVAQVEIGEAGGEHLQFFVTFPEGKTLSAVSKLFPGAHLERSFKPAAAKAYCCKSRTAVEGSLRVKGYDIEGAQKAARWTCKDPLEGRELYPWQQRVIDIVNGPVDERKIYWFWEPVGCTGKSTLVKHLCLTNPGCLPAAGKAADMKHLIHGWLAGHNELKTLLVDLSRSREQFISYEGIEDVKNGLIVNTKYETAVDMFDPPHVICFANWEPDRSALSADRWEVIRLGAIDDFTPEEASVVGDDHPDVDGDVEGGVLVDDAYVERWLGGGVVGDTGLELVVAENTLPANPSSLGRADIPAQVSGPTSNLGSEDETPGVRLLKQGAGDGADSAVVVPVNEDLPIVVGGLVGEPDFVGHSSDSVFVVKGGELIESVGLVPSDSDVGVVEAIDPILQNPGGATGACDPVESAIAQLSRVAIGQGP